MPPGVSYTPLDFIPINLFSTKSTRPIPLFPASWLSFSNNFEGESFLRTVIWEFPSYQKAIECHDSKEYQAGWDLAKKTTVRHMQVIEGFSTE